MLLDEFLIFKGNFNWELRAQILVYKLFLYMYYFQISLPPPSFFCFLSMVWPTYLLKGETKSDLINKLTANKLVKHTPNAQYQIPFLHI